MVPFTLSGNRVHRRGAVAVIPPRRSHPPRPADGAVGHDVRSTGRHAVAVIGAIARTRRGRHTVLSRRRRRVHGWPRHRSCGHFVAAPAEDDDGAIGDATSGPQAVATPSQLSRHAVPAGGDGAGVGRRRVHGRATPSQLSAVARPPRAGNCYRRRRQVPGSSHAVAVRSRRMRLPGPDGAGIGDVGSTGGGHAVQLSATSHAPAEGRHTVLDRPRRRVHAVATPSQLSAMQSPAEDDRPVLESATTSVHRPWPRRRCRTSQSPAEAGGAVLVVSATTSGHRPWPRRRSCRSPQAPAEAGNGAGWRRRRSTGRGHAVAVVDHVARTRRGPADGAGVGDDVGSQAVVTPSQLSAIAGAQEPQTCWCRHDVSPQAVATPSQLSATSHAPAEGRRWCWIGDDVGGVAADEPSQTSGHVQAPAARGKRPRLPGTLELAAGGGGSCRPCTIGVVAAHVDAGVAARSSA
jgi:hypothetical protein